MIIILIAVKFINCKRKQLFQFHLPFIYFRLLRELDDEKEEEEEEEEKYSAGNNEVSVVSISFAMYLI